MKNFIKKMFTKKPPVMPEPQPEFDYDQYIFRQQLLGVVASMYQCVDDFKQSRIFAVAQSKGLDILNTVNQMENDIEHTDSYIQSIIKAGVKIEEHHVINFTMQAMKANRILKSLDQ